METILISTEFSPRKGTPSLGLLDEEKRSRRSITSWYIYNFVHLHFYSFTQTLEICLNVERERERERERDYSMESARWAENGVKWSPNWRERGIVGWKNEIRVWCSDESNAGGGNKKHLGGRFEKPFPESVLLLHHHHRPPTYMKKKKKKNI